MACTFGDVRKLSDSAPSEFQNRISTLCFTQVICNDCIHMQKLDPCTEPFVQKKNLFSIRFVQDRTEHEHLIKMCAIVSFLCAERR